MPLACDTHINIKIQKAVMVFYLVNLSHTTAGLWPMMVVKKQSIYDKLNYTKCIIVKQIGI